MVEPNNIARAMLLEIHSTKEAVVINVMVLVFHPICTSAAIASRRAVIFPRPNPPVGPSASLPDTLGVRNPGCCGQKQIHTHESGVLRGKGNFKVESSPRLGRARPLARLIIRSPYKSIPPCFFAGGCTRSSRIARWSRACSSATKTTTRTAKWCSRRTRDDSPTRWASRND